MSSETAIRVRGLGKQYQIGAQQARYSTLRDRIADAAMRPWRRLTRRESLIGPTSTMWALKDVTFDVYPGDVVGVIGGNGAGKSTLLKVLSRITEPTEGEAVIDGRVGSLLEVGTGFHPELTGRENIYLNGAILGMRKAEIDRKFDEMVAFAEVDKFIDTPVRHYSSGMYVRLAFAVAAHMDPEILIVDEVLAVGDSQFQKKCLGKLNDVARGGRTVLFVSHNMAAIQRLCTRALLLERGRVIADGHPRETVAGYLSSNVRPRFEAALRTGLPQVLEADVQDRLGRPLARAFSHDPIVVRVRYVVPPGFPDTRVGIGLLSMDGVPLFTSGSRDDGVEGSDGPGEYEAHVTIPADVLLAGDFQLATCLWNPREVFDWQEPALMFAVDPGPSAIYADGDVRKGFVHIACGWRIRSVVPETAIR